MMRIIYSLRGGALPRRNLAAGLLAAGLAGAALLPLPNPESELPPEAFKEVEAALAEVESGEAEKKAQDVAAEAGLVAGAAPCFMRHKKMALGIEQSFRARFAAATVATGYETKSGLLSELAAEAQPGVMTWRVALAQAEVAVRNGLPKDSLPHLERASQQEVPASCRADELFLRAAISPPAQAAMLLDAAIEADPSFWAAHERLALLAAAGTGSHPGACDADAARTIRSTTQLAALASGRPR